MALTMIHQRVASDPRCEHCGNCLASLDARCYRCVQAHGPMKFHRDYFSFKWPMPAEKGARDYLRNEG